MHPTLAALWIKARQAELLTEARHTHLADTARRHSSLPDVRGVDPRSTGVRSTARRDTSARGSGLHGIGFRGVGFRGVGLRGVGLRGVGLRGVKTLGIGLVDVRSRVTNLRRAAGRALVHLGTLVAGETPRATRP